MSEQETPDQHQPDGESANPFAAPPKPHADAAGPASTDPAAADPAAADPAAADPAAAAPIVVEAAKASTSGRRVRRRRAKSGAAVLFRPSRRAWAAQALRTTAVSIRRNGPLTAAGVLCAAVALTLVGASLLVSAGVDNATIRWRGGVETIVFLDPGASAEFIDRIGDELAENPVVADISFVSQQDAYREFEIMFANSPELVDSISATDLPASWRVVPVAGADEDAVAAIGEPFMDRRGIYQVVYARDAVESVMAVSRVVRLSLLGLAVVLGAAAWLLVWTTCRTAAWARRDELAVMRLIGAPRTLVAVPFVAEGAIQGLIGGAVAATSTWTMAGILEAKVVEGDALAILKNFSVASGTVTTICALLVAAGTLAGAVGAALAVNRYVNAGDGVPVTFRGKALGALATGARRSRAALGARRREQGAS